MFYAFSNLLYDFYKLMSKKPCPEVEKALTEYRVLKNRLINYFFHKVPLSITNSEFMKSYT